MDEVTDEALARRAAAGDRDAFAALIERYYDHIYRLGVRMMSGNAEDAADLAQDVCVALPAKLGSYRGESKFTTWLHRVVVNAANDAWRRRAVWHRSERGAAEIEALARSGETDAECDRLWLRQALGHLSEALWSTAVLVLSGLSHAEAGAVLEVSESTVSWRMHEVRRRLRALADETEAVR